MSFRLVSSVAHQVSPFRHLYLLADPRRGMRETSTDVASSSALCSLVNPSLLSLLLSYSLLPAHPDLLRYIHATRLIRRAPPPPRPHLPPRPAPDLVRKGHRSPLAR